jgi:hypothetical protein
MLTMTLTMYNQSRNLPQMDEEQIADIWILFKEYLDKKQIEIVAEKFVDHLADYGVEDHQLKDLFGIDSALDEAIGYYLDIDSENYVDDEDEWD